MADETDKTNDGETAAAAGATTGNGKSPQLSILTQYVKDLSFESPGAPMTLRQRDERQQSRPDHDPPFVQCLAPGHSWYGAT